MATILARIILIAGAAVVVYLVWSTQNATNLNLFGSQITISAGLLVLIGYLVGLSALVSYSFALKGQKKQTEAHIEEWKKQDTKLVASVQTDREKQLEAKIDTLEKALKHALKKD